MTHSKQFKSTVEMITWARHQLELPETATADQIKQNFKRVIKKWHPDHCREDQKQCREIAERIIEANKIIRAYCRRYKFSFSVEEIQKYRTTNEWWLDKFGNDPLWGNYEKEKK